MEFGLTWAGDGIQSVSRDVVDQSEAREVRDDALQIRGSKELVVFHVRPKLMSQTSADCNSGLESQRAAHRVECLFGNYVYLIIVIEGQEGCDSKMNCCICEIEIYLDSIYYSLNCVLLRLTRAPYSHPPSLPQNL
jgi:hypothetical protein